MRRRPTTATKLIEFIDYIDCVFGGSGPVRDSTHSRQRDVITTQDFVSYVIDGAVKRVHGILTGLLGERAYRQEF